MDIEVARDLGVDAIEKAPELLRTMLVPKILTRSIPEILATPA
jgi:hypothetical protein